MGGSQSREQTNPNKKPDAQDSTAIANKVVMNLSRMNEVFQHQKNNNLGELKNYVKSLVNNPNMEKSLNPLLPQIEQYIHKYDSMFRQNGNPSVSSRKNNTNEELYRYLSRYQDERMTKIKDEIEKLAKTTIPEGEFVKDIDIMVKNVVNNNTKARFYEYKYIGLNIFMISLLHNLYSSMIRFMKEIDEYNQIRMDVQKRSAKTLIEKVKQVIDENVELDNGKPAKMKFEDLTKLDTSLETAIKNIDEWGKKIQDRSQQQIKDLKEMMETLSKYDQSNFDANIKQKRYNQSNNIMGDDEYIYDDESDEDDYNSDNLRFMRGGHIRVGTPIDYDDSYKP